MCLTISFWEIFPKGTWQPGGWVGEIDDGRGIRHYAEFYVCKHNTFTNYETYDERIIPNSGFLQVEMDFNHENNNENTQEIQESTQESIWEEYAIHDADIIECQVLSNTLSISLALHNMEDNIHKSIDNVPYCYMIQNINIQ